MTRIEQKRMLGKLFDSIPTDTYNRVFKKLQEMRMLHPSNRDDELLMLMLCQRIEGYREMTEL